MTEGRGEVPDGISTNNLLHCSRLARAQEAINWLRQDLLTQDQLDEVIKILNKENCSLDEAYRKFLNKGLSNN